MYSGISVCIRDHDIAINLILLVAQFALSTLFLGNFSVIKPNGFDILVQAACIM